MNFWPWSRFPDHLEDQDEETRRVRRLRVGLWTGGIVCVVIGVGVIGVRWAFHHAAKGAVKRAADYVEARDFRSAQLTLEQAVQVNPDNMDAKRALAEFYTQFAPSQALPLWEQLHGQDDGNVDYLLGLSQSALLAGKYDRARQALDQMPDEGRGRADYKRQRAAVALALRDAGELKRQLGELAVLEPDNMRVQYNAAAAASHSADPVEAAAAREKLVSLARGDALRIRATLQLLQLAGTASDAENALRRLAVDILGEARGRGAGFFELAEHMKGERSPSAEDAAALVEWMAAHDWPREAFLWTADLPEAVRRAPVVRKALAECAVRMGDWSRLSDQLRGGAWGRMPEGMLELAFASRIQREGPARLRSLSTWEDAVELAWKASSRPGLDALDRLAVLWRWSEAEEAALRKASELVPAEVLYHRKLAGLAESRGDSIRLAAVYRDWTEAIPDDRYAWSSRLYLAVIQNTVDPVLRAKASALGMRPDLLPEEAMICAWVEGVSGSEAAAAALSRFGTTISAVRQRPRAAMLQADLLVKAGRIDEARESWRAAAALPARLPEERAWMARLRKRLESAP